MQKIGVKFTGILAFFYAMFAIGPAFYVVVLEQKGLPTSYIGIYTATIALAATLTQPIYGYFCDKTCKARQILIVTVAMAVAGYGCLIVLENPIALFICSVFIGATLNAMYGFSEGWLSKLGCDRMGVNFGAVRSFGSLSYALSAALYGFVFDAFGLLSMPLCMLVCFVGMTVIALRCPNPRPAPLGEDSAPQMEQTEAIGFSEAFRALLQNKRYLVVVICFTLAAIPTGAMLSYYPSHLSDLGGTASSVGLAMFFMAGSEFLMMQNYRRLERRFGATKLIGFALLMYAVKNIAIALAPSVTLAVFAAVTQAFCYGLMVPATQSFVAKEVPHRYASTGQLVCNSGGMMLSQLPGALLGGFLVRQMSAGQMLLQMSAFALVAFVIYVVAMQKYKK